MSEGTHLILLRHAEAAEKQEGQRDFDRPLTRVGEEQARQLGKNWRHHAIALDLIICSAAVRAHQTAQLFAAAARLGAGIQPVHDLYSGMVTTYLSHIRSAKANHLLVVGHNSTISQLASQLTHDSFYFAPAHGCIVVWSKQAQLGQMPHHVLPLHP